MTHEQIISKRQLVFDGDTVIFECGNYFNFKEMMYDFLIENDYNFNKIIPSFTEMKDIIENDLHGEIKYIYKEVL